MHVFVVGKEGARDVGQHVIGHSLQVFNRLDLVGGLHTREEAIAGAALVHEPETGCSADVSALAVHLLLFRQPVLCISDGCWHLAGARNVGRREGAELVALEGLALACLAEDGCSGCGGGVSVLF